MKTYAIGYYSYINICNNFFNEIIQQQLNFKYMCTYI